MSIMPAALAEAVAAAPPTAPENKVEELRKGCAALRDARREKEDLEERLKALNKAIQDLEFTRLPELMDQVGTDKHGIPPEGNQPGYDCLLQPYYKASIAADWEPERREAGFSALIDEGGEALIKHQVTLTFDRGEETQVRNLLDLLKSEGYTYRVDMAVAWNTLTAWLKERCTNGNTPGPTTLEAIGATVGRIVKLKPRKA